MLCALCAVGFKKDGKVQKLETQRSIPVLVLTSRHTEYKQDLSGQAGGTFRHSNAEIYSSSTTGSDIYYGVVNVLLKCCVMIQ